MWTKLELKLVSTTRDTKKGFLNYVNSKRRTRDNFGLLLDRDGLFTNRNTDKKDTFKALFTSVSNTDNVRGL